MKIAVNNSQVQLQVQAEKIRKLAVFFMQKTAELTPHVKWSDISILLADNNLIAEINSSYLGKKRPTDVISFALEPLPARAQGGEAMNAEIIVNAERAMETGLSLTVLSGNSRYISRTDATIFPAPTMEHRPTGKNARQRVAMD